MPSPSSTLSELVGVPNAKTLAVGTTAMEKSPGFEAPGMARAPAAPVIIMMPTDSAARTVFASFTNLSLLYDVARGQDVAKLSPNSCDQGSDIGRLPRHASRSRSLRRPNQQLSGRLSKFGRGRGPTNSSGGRPFRASARQRHQAPSAPAVIGWGYRRCRIHASVDAL